MQVPDLLALCLDSAPAHRRVEANKQLSLSVHAAPLEVVAEEGEAGSVKVARQPTTEILMQR